MHSSDNHIKTHTFHPRLSHKPLLHHVDHEQIPNQQTPQASLNNSTQNDTHVLPKSCTPKYFDQQALHPYLYCTTSACLNPSHLDPINTYAIKSCKGTDDNMGFHSCPLYGVNVKEDYTIVGLNSGIQEEKRRANSHKVHKDDTNIGLNSSTQEKKRRASSEKDLVSQSLDPNNIYAINMQEIDEKRSSFTSVMKVQEDDTNMALKSSNIFIQEEKKRGNYYDKKEDHLSSKKGNFDVSTPTKNDANNDGDILNYSPISNPKSEVNSMESLSANPSRRASICKASKSPRKKKAHQLKQIICVPMASGNKSPGECLHSDSWTWRKYGQKPIKGSPYPRGYYRCSTCKGCTARKQVERSRSDPSMLVITYTSEHNHTWQATQKNLQKSEATLNEKPYSIHPQENPNSINSSIQHLDNIHVKMLSIDSPCITTLEVSSPCIRGINYIDNLQDERPENELDYFGLLEELPNNSSFMTFESAKSPLLEHEDPITIVHSNVVDPFNLFNWSSTIGLNYYSAT